MGMYKYDANGFVIAEFGNECSDLGVRVGNVGIDSQRIKLRASDVMAKCPIYSGGDVVGGRMSPPGSYLPSCRRWLAFVTARDQDWSMVFSKSSKSSMWRSMRSKLGTSPVASSRTTKPVADFEVR